MQMERLSSGDLRTVERLIDEVGLDKGVVNVLIAYVLQIKDRKMPGYEYLEKHALDWKRQGIENVKLAIDYVQHLSSDYARRKDEKKFGKNGKEKLPEVDIPWLDEYWSETKK
jgi:replication initiation and membrane attachment protein DnaB